MRLLNDQLGDGSLRWLAGEGPDKKAPKYKERPSSSEGFYEQDKTGGLTRKLRLRTLVEESSPAWFLVSMQRARGGSARQQYPVPLEGDTFTIGHDACSGNFGFDDGRAYKLTARALRRRGEQGHGETEPRGRCPQAPAVTERAASAERQGGATSLSSVLAVLLPWELLAGPWRGRSSPPCSCL